MSGLLWSRMCPVQVLYSFSVSTAARRYGTQLLASYRSQAENVAVFAWQKAPVDTTQNAVRPGERHADGLAALTELRGPDGGTGCCF